MTTQPTREQVVPTQAGILRAMARNYAPGNLWDHLDAKAVSKAADELDDLEATVAEQEAEIERLNRAVKIANELLDLEGPEDAETIIDQLRRQLAAAQLRIEEQKAEIERLTFLAGNFEEQAKNNLIHWNECASTLNQQLAAPIQSTQGWQPIETAPKDNKRQLYLARLNENGELLELDFEGGWDFWQESWELPHINGWYWGSAHGIEEPTHWSYQEEPPPATNPQPATLADDDVRDAEIGRMVRRLVDGGPYDLTDSPKSFINNVRYIVSSVSAAKGKK